MSRYPAFESRKTKHDADSDFHYDHNLPTLGKKTEAKYDPEKFTVLYKRFRDTVRRWHSEADVNSVLPPNAQDAEKPNHVLGDPYYLPVSEWRRQMQIDFDIEDSIFAKAEGEGKEVWTPMNDHRTEPKGAQFPAPGYVRFDVAAHQAARQATRQAAIQAATGANSSTESGAS